MKNLYLILICAIGLSCGAGNARAQSAAACSKNIYAPVPDSILKEQARKRAEEQAREEAKMKLYRRHTPISMPDTVMKLLYYEAKFDQAFAVLQEFVQEKAQDPDVDPYYLVALEQEYYAKRRFLDSANFDFYTQKRQEFVDRLLNEFPNHVEANFFNLSQEPTEEEELQMFSRILELDSTYLPIYEQRGLYWLEHKQMDKFCEDFRRLPFQIANRHPAFWNCK